MLQRQKYRRMTLVKVPVDEQYRLRLFREVEGGGRWGWKDTGSGNENEKQSPTGTSVKDVTKDCD